MKLRTKILLPLATVASAATIAIPLTSCSRAGLMGTHDMLEANYIHHVTPSTARTIYGQDTIIQEYLKDSQYYTDIIKDDILFTYSKILSNESYRSKLDFTLSRYFLYVDNISVDVNAKTISMYLWAEVTGTVKDDKVAEYDLDKDLYLRDFTAIIGSEFKFNIQSASVRKQTEDPYKDCIEFKATRDETEVPRIYFDGIVNTSTTPTGAKKQATAYADITAKWSDNTVMHKLFTNLVYNVPTIGLGLLNTTFTIESYYFKNVYYKA